GRLTSARNRAHIRARVWRDSAACCLQSRVTGEPSVNGFHVVAYFPMFFGLLLAAAAVVPAPCTSATLDCSEWIKPAGQPSRVLVYRTQPLETKNENITRAFVFVHGILRDADNHFRTALAAAFLGNALNDTVIVAPRFASNSSAPGNEAGNCRDALA